MAFVAVRSALATANEFWARIWGLPVALLTGVRLPPLENLRQRNAVITAARD